MKRFLVMIKETSTNSSSFLSHRKQLQSLDMTKKQLPESTGEWTDRPRGSSHRQGEEEKGSSMRKCPSVVLSLGLSAVHAAYTVVRADTEKPTVFLTQGTGKGKLANCKYWSEWGKSHKGKGTSRANICLPDWPLNHTDKKQTQSNPAQGKRSKQSINNRVYTVQAQPREWPTKIKETLFISGK